MDTKTETILGKRILLVDDERLMREFIRALLTRDEHIVVEANNGAEAYTLFTEGHFDLVMTDSVMPFVNGEELAIRIRRLAPQQPILMITGHEMRRGVSNPADAILYKPFDYAGLRKAMARLLEN